MKIISKYRDYYDSAMGLGHDDSTVFVRTPVEFKDNTHPMVAKLQTMLSNSRQKHDLFNNHNISRLTIRYRIFHVNRVENNQLINRNYEFQEFEVIFCGEAYRGVEVKTWNESFASSAVYDYFYNKDEFLTYVEEAGIDIFGNRYKKKDIDQFFGEIALDKDFLVENKISIAVRYGNSITINELLGNYKFYKVYDAYSAFQKLDAWVSGILAYPPNFMIEVEDKYKISGHGFDPKYGFRKRPTK